jgi:shikimate kinase
MCVEPGGVGGVDSAKRHIAFVGFMAAGKTTCARLMAQRYGRRFVDIDDDIESRVGMTISEMFATQGERAFRATETAVLDAALAQRETCCVATGGGVLTTPENLPLLRASAVIVYLRVKPERALARIHNFASRPLLETAGSTEVIFALAQARTALYEAACDFSVSTNKRTPDEVVDITVERIRERGYGHLLS